ncbi:InlB B-repeat-containing protein, partial [Butyrivibrio sp. AD3002]|uniref:InlB B-repeat-containing protein n=1 Tax=Butyrivibrio sp. AD3002 TaxID=1280670 RepID=UPI00047B8BE1
MRKNIARKLAAFMALVVLLTTFGSDYNSIGARANSDVDAIEQGLSDENGLWEPQGAEQQNVQEAEEPAPEVVEEPQVEEPQVEEPQVEEPPAEEPVQEEPQVEEPQAEAPAEEAQVEEPAENVENPDAQPTEEVQPTEIPEEETPAADTPAEETPSAETPAEENGEAVVPEEAPAEAGEAEAPTAETPQGIVISYVAAEGGKVSVETETVTEAAAGSTAIADEGYKFANWTDAAATVVGEEATFVPSAEQTVEGAVFTANFEKLAVEAEPEVDMPAVIFDDEAGDISVHVEAGEGAFPEGTIMKVTAVYDQAILDTAAQAAGVEADSTAAVDITFYYKDKDIEPEKPIKVQLHSKVITESDEAQVVHISDDGDANVISDASMNGDTAEFNSSDFSVYVVVGKDDDNCRVKVVFKNGDEEIASMYVKKNDKMEQVLYDPGVGQLAAGVNFAGWTTDKNYEPDATGLTIQEIRDTVNGMLPPAIDADEEGGTVLEYYAMFLKQYKVKYLENEVVLGEHAVNVRADATGDASIRPYTVNMAYTVPDDEHKFEGWLVAEGNGNIVDRGGVETDKPFPNPTDITIKGDVAFSVDAPSGHWLVFDENGKGATYCAPIFVKADEVTRKSRPDEEMTRKGYSFGGWFKDKACTDGNEFTFGNPLTEKTTIYAKWTPNNEAPYTILIWKQNAAKNGYDFAGSAVGKGRVGKKIKEDEKAIEEKTIGDVKYAVIAKEQYGGVKSADAENLPNIKHPEFVGFTLKNVEDATITAEGTGVANVYFDRVQYTLKMYLTRKTGNNTYTGSQYAGNGAYGGAWNLPLNGITKIKGTAPGTADGQYYYYPITAYYGDDISGLWPTYEEVQPSGQTFVSWLLRKGAKSYTSSGNGGNTVKGVIGIMDECVLADLTSKDGNYVVARYDSDPYNWTYNLYFADANGEYPAEPSKKVTVRSNQSGIDSQHAPPIDGYEYVKRDGYSVTERPKTGTINYYYQPKAFAINYMDGKYANGSDGEIQNNSGVQLTERDDIKFGADISGYNITVDCPEPGYVFEGWYMDKACNSKYDFNTTMPMGGVTVFAKWRQIQYRAFLHPNMEGADWGNNQAMDFRVDYGAKISSPTGRKAGYRFVGWYTTPDFKPDSVFNGDVYVLNEDTVTTPYTDKLPEDANRFWITKQFDIYAEWREVLDGAEGINVVYSLTDPDIDGKGHPGTGTGTAEDKGLYVDNSRAIAVPAVKAPEGYVFSNWVVQKYISGDKYEDVQDVFPGGSYDIKAAYAKVTSLGGGKNSYVIQLRAEYKLKEEATPTYIPWYANDNTAAFTIDKVDAGETTDKSTLQINEAVEIKTVPDTSSYKSKYEFKGWAKVNMGNTDEEASRFMNNSANWKKSGLSLFIPYENGAFTYEGKAATKVAANEAMPYQALFAVWEDKLTYHSNTEDDETFEQTGDPESTLTVAANSFENGEYTFLGWNTKPDGTGTTYQPDSSYTLTEDVDELFAMWEDTLTYKANTGAAVEDIVDKGEIGEGLTVRAADTFTNGTYKFKEWNTQADGQGTTYEPGNTYTLTDEDDVLYAIWEDTLTYKA